MCRKVIFRGYTCQVPEWEPGGCTSVWACETMDASLEHARELRALGRGGGLGLRRYRIEVVATPDAPVYVTNRPAVYAGGVVTDSFHIRCAAGCVEVYDV